MDARHPRRASADPGRGALFAEQHDLRIIGVDRPGIGFSTPHLYSNILDWTGDLAELCDVLDIDTLRVIGLSGGGPYALAAGPPCPTGCTASVCSGEWPPRRGPTPSPAG